MIWRWTPFSALALCTFSTMWADTSKLFSSSSHVTWGSTSHTRNSEMSPCHARAWNYTFGSLSQPDFIIPTLFQYIIMCHQLSLLSFINISLLYSFLSVVIALHLFRSWAHPFWAALAVVIESICSAGQKSIIKSPEYLLAYLQDRVTGCELKSNRDIPHCWNSYFSTTI